MNILAKISGGQTHTTNKMYYNTFYKLCFIQKNNINNDYL